mmetsp:Transcript_1216/g.3711  ORF Transcript_1216/g.3711 Transcript_1216/m.3711 type:complete len:424 (+) Transcript_1216:451-1722(+)
MIIIDDHLFENRTDLREGQTPVLFVVPAAFDHLPERRWCGRKLLVLRLLWDHETTTVQHELNDLWRPHMRIGNTQRQELPGHHGERINISSSGKRLSMNTFWRDPSSRSTACDRLIDRLHAVQTIVGDLDVEMAVEEDVLGGEVAVQHRWIQGVQVAHASGHREQHAETSSPGQMRVRVSQHACHRSAIAVLGDHREVGRRGAGAKELDQMHMFHVPQHVHVLAELGDGAFVHLLSVKTFDGHAVRLPLALEHFAKAAHTGLLHHPQVTVADHPAILLCSHGQRATCRLSALMCDLCVATSLCWRVLGATSRCARATQEETACDQTHWEHVMNCSSTTFNALMEDSTLIVLFNHSIPSLLTEQDFSSLGKTSHVCCLVHDHANVVHSSGGDVCGNGRRSSVNPHLHTKTSKYQSTKVVPVLFG